MISSTLTCSFFSRTSICASRSTCSFAVDVYVLPATAPGPVNGLAPRLGVCAFVLECGSIFPVLPWCICRQCLASAGLSRFPHGPSVGAILPQCSLGSPLPLPCPMCRFHFDNPPQRFHVLILRRCPRICDLSCAGHHTATASRGKALRRFVRAVVRRNMDAHDLADCGVPCAPPRRAICVILSAEK